MPNQESEMRKEQEGKRFSIRAHLGGPWHWKVWDAERGEGVAFHVDLEDAKASADQLNENGYVDA